MLCSCKKIISPYSHLKNLTPTPAQITVTAAITAADNRQFSAGKPRKAAFISAMP